MYESEILKKAEEIKEELISIRRDIHSHPEVGLHENRTASIVAEKLMELGLEVKTNVGVTGVVGILRGKNPGKTIMLRADMDCLKLTELNEVEYKSEIPGLMHACGHDAHTSWLLGAAEILCKYKDKLNGNVKFVFQPSEEIGGGAEGMIEGGVLEDPKVDAVIGAHVWPSIESGKIGIKYGPLMAASDSFSLTIYGKGGHGGQPDRCIDPIPVACEIYMAFQTIISRKLDPLEPAVITVGKFNAGSAHNVIPDKVEMEGTIRTLTYEVREKIPEMMENIIKGLTLANDADYEFSYTPYHPPVINDHELTDLVGITAAKLLGKDKVLRLTKGTMAGEDFSFYQEKVPAVFFWIGTYNAEKGINKPLHSPEFNVDEDIIHKASAIFAECALNYLSPEDILKK